jgi:hypothetical protein
MHVFIVALGLLSSSELSPEKAAAIQRDRDNAMTEIEQRYSAKGERLSSDDRREMIREQRSAEDAVLEKHQVGAKDMARYEAKMSLGDRSRAKVERNRLDKQPTDRKTSEITIQRGPSEKNPVVVYEKPGSEGRSAEEEDGFEKDGMDSFSATPAPIRAQAPTRVKSKSSSKTKAPSKAKPRKSKRRTSR